MNDSSKDPASGSREELPTVTREIARRYLAESCSEQNLTEEDKEKFATMAVTYSLNPYKREIHVKIETEKGKRKCVLIVGYEVYIKRAERTGQLDGWKAWVEGSGEELKAIVEIHRKDWKEPFVHEVYWNEAVQKSEDGKPFDFWARMPRFQLKKVAISQGFRLCFADELGGIPYDASELPIARGPDGDQKNAPRSEVAETESTAESAPLPSSASASEVKSTSTLCSGEKLPDTIRTLALEHKELFSSQHMEWVVNQLRTEKSERQLRGLLRHVEGTIASGGDKETHPQNVPPRVANTHRRVPSRQKAPAAPHATGSDNVVF